MGKIYEIDRWLFYQLPEPDDAIAHLTNTVYNLFDKHVPIKDVSLKKPEKFPLITSEVLKIMKERDAALKKQRYHHLR